MERFRNENVIKRIFWGELSVLVHRCKNSHVLICIILVSNFGCDDFIDKRAFIRTFENESRLIADTIDVTLEVVDVRIQTDFVKCAVDAQVSTLCIRAFHRGINGIPY